jgi:nicotinamide mononucleotide transporter
MLAQKKIEHWLIWIAVDALSIGLFIVKGLYPTTLLFFVYTVLAVYGYMEWRKEINPEKWEATSV